MKGNKKCKFRNLTGVVKLNMSGVCMRWWGKAKKIKIEIKDLLTECKDELIMPLKMYGFIFAVVVSLNIFSGGVIKKQADYFNDLSMPFIELIVWVVIMKTYKETKEENWRLKARESMGREERLRERVEKDINHIDFKMIHARFIDETKYFKEKKSQSDRMVEQEAKFDEIMRSYLMCEEGSAFRTLVEDYISYRRIVLENHSKNSSFKKDGVYNGNYPCLLKNDKIKGYLRQAIKIYSQRPNDIQCEGCLKEIAEGMFDKTDDLKRQFNSLVVELFDTGINVTGQTS